MESYCSPLSKKNKNITKGTCFSQSLVDKVVNTYNKTEKNKITTGNSPINIKLLEKKFGNPNLWDLNPNLSHIKDEIKDEGGEEEFWSQGTDADKGSKEEKKNEVLLRRVVREVLLREAVA